MSPTLFWPQNADHAYYPANYLRPADQRVLMRRQGSAF
jgi:hypothetical protein